MLAGVALEEMFGRGFTTVRDAGGADVGFRRAIEQGAINGPRLLPSGRPFTQTGGHGDQRSGPDFSGRRWDEHVGLVHVVADGPDEVRWAAREELRRGADQIKVMASGVVASPTDRLESVQHSLEELSSAGAAAQAVGTYVLALAYKPASIAMCVAAGVRSIEHGKLLDEPTAKLMAANGTFRVPTLVAYEKRHSEGARHGGRKRASTSWLGLSTPASRASRSRPMPVSASLPAQTCSGRCVATKAKRSPSRPALSEQWEQLSPPPARRLSSSASSRRSAQSRSETRPISSWPTATSSRTLDHSGATAASYSWSSVAGWSITGLADRCDALMRVVDATYSRSFRG